MKNMTMSCRLCLEESGSLKEDMIEIFDDKKNSTSILDVIKQHFSWLEIQPDDAYSKVICVGCWTIVNKFHSLYINVDAVHQKLNMLCDEIIIKIEDISTSNVTENFSCEDKNQIQSFEHEISEGVVELVRKSKRSIAKKLKVKVKTKIDKRSKTALQNKKRIWKTKSERTEDEKKINEFYDLNCDQCSTKFSSYLSLTDHQRSEHHIKRGFVYCCNKKMNCHAKLVEHMNWHHNPDSFRCKICQKLYSDKYGLRLHMAYHEPAEAKVFECDICSKKFSRKAHLTHHLVVVHITKNKKDHKCAECGKTFGLKSILQSHIRGVHQNTYRHICDVCAKDFKSKEQYNRHRLEHVKNIPKLICECGARLKNLNSLHAHIRRTHQNSPQTCPECGKISPNKDALRCHIRYNHQDSRQYSCTVCAKMFKKEVSLKEHVATHLGIALYTCPYCTKTFKSNANMHSHRKKVHFSEWQRDRTRSS